MPDALDQNNQAIAALAAQETPSIGDVVALLDAIAEKAAELDRGRADGIACFSRLYRTITHDVLGEYEARGLFARRKFIWELDLAFARRYLDALHAYGSGQHTPACWRLLFDQRQSPRAEWRFAVVGVNAHVNFDLAFALLDVWTANDTPLATTAEQYDDYEAINTIFHRRMDELCEDNEVPWTDWGPIARDGGIIDRIGNLACDFLVRGTRDFAWSHAERWYPQRHEENYREGPTAMLDFASVKIAEIFI